MKRWFMNKVRHLLIKLIAQQVRRQRMAIANEDMISRPRNGF